MIRRMTLKDIDIIMPLIKTHFDVVHMEDRLNTFNEATIRRSLEKAVTEMVTFVNESNNKIDGIITYAFYPSLFDDKLRATEICWYAYSPKIMIKLHQYMMSFIKNHVDVISIGIPTTNDVGKYLIRDGFKLTEHVYSKKGGN